eukprot:6212248-Pleurochrysis_carterae.AAC.9
MHWLRLPYCQGRAFQRREEVRGQVSLDQDMVLPLPLPRGRRYVADRQEPQPPLHRGAHGPEGGGLCRARGRPEGGRDGEGRRGAGARRRRAHSTSWSLPHACTHAHAQARTQPRAQKGIFARGARAPMHTLPRPHAHTRMSARVPAHMRTARTSVRGTHPPSCSQ